MPCATGAFCSLPFFAWLFQLLASLAWFTSVLIYGSYETGDIFQLVAALCWTVSNGLALPDIFCGSTPVKKAKVDPDVEHGGL